MIDATDPLAILHRLHGATTRNGQHDHEPEPFLTPSWPMLDRAALHGPAGGIVDALDPTTEADPVAVLATFLTMFGNVVNRGPHVMVGDDRHGTNLDIALVGDTGEGRKGTSRSGPERLLGLVDVEWATARIQGGLSSGEGLVWAIRDPRYEIDRKTGEDRLVDPGVTDKRLLCIEEELSFVLKAAQRQGNTITEIMRRAWDGREQVQIMTKHSAATATKPHVSILAHITRAELTRNLTDTDVANGFANRFIWLLVKRSKLLPEPVRLSSAAAGELAAELSKAYTHALSVGELVRDTEAKAVWAAVYPALTTGRLGLAGALTARAAPQVLRLSLLYALLDRDSAIRRTHLEAALALWDYADASVRGIFGDLTGDAIADRVLAVLRREGEKSRSEILDLFGRNVGSARLSHALELLITEGKVVSHQAEPEGRGRPPVIYTAVPIKESR